MSPRSFRIQKYKSLYIDLIEDPAFLALDSVFPFSHQALTTLLKHYTLSLVTFRETDRDLKVSFSNLLYPLIFHTCMRVHRIYKTKASLIPVQHKSSAFAVIGDTEADIILAHDLKSSLYCGDKRHTE